MCAGIAKGTQWEKAGSKWGLGAPVKSVQITDPELKYYYDRAGRTIAAKGQATPLSSTQQVARREIEQEQLRRNEATAAQDAMTKLGKEREAVMAEQAAQQQRMQAKAALAQQQMQQQAAQQQQLMQASQAATLGGIESRGAAVSQSLKILSAAQTGGKQAPTAQMAAKAGRARRRPSTAASLRMGSTSQGTGSGANIAV